ncbi:MAG: hypothetical protein DRN35_00210 [Thermoplasmata archaeon]|nr:MAG: hypothetical protein DRN40_05810 [Thermoplasmata archaeon]RLF72612.1 MAG: hypothetical protein DRN35_00210 [Thermoplasmata archaeon]RLF74188.1 MAG: hypothetical protein DRN55_00945 [Thermoplasmata archaeon]RLF76416.1 MAG: hypothetical protein DRN42_01080 [Thermoplasmata archaeon]HDD59473.1 hypothetical protein [Euryarchaeota archaeon]
MGFSLSSSHMIFFIGALIVASSAMAIMVNVILTISTNVESRGEDLSNKILSDITIINDPENIPQDPLTIYVKNTGRVKLDTTLDIFLDNEYIKNATVTQLDNNTDLWQPGEIVMITIPGVSLSSGEHTIIVITSSGVSDRLVFIVRGD